MKEKILLGFFLSIAFIIMSILVWIFAPSFGINKLIMIIINIFTILTLTISINLLGAISPNFSDARDPEKVSTSGTGLFSLAIGVVIVAANAWIINAYLNNYLTFTVFILETAFINGLILGFIFILYQKKRLYEF